MLLVCRADAAGSANTFKRDFGKGIRRLVFIVRVAGLVLPHRVTVQCMFLGQDCVKKAVQAHLYPYLERVVTMHTCRIQNRELLGNLNPDPP